MTASILILNARIVNEGAVTAGDVLVQNGRIETIGSDLSARQAKIRIDAAGKALLPGLIDDQVHFREPGLTHKGDIATESQAAVAGGITSFMEMPNTRPTTTDAAALEDKLARAARTACANYAFYFGATNTNLEAVKAVNPQHTCGVKVFMGASTGNMLVDDPAVLEGIFAHAPVMVATHCEDTPTILRNEGLFRERFGEDVPFRHHPEIRSREACFKSSSLAVELARRLGTRLHVLHLTTADELALFDVGPADAKQVTAEVCVHHLHFARPDYDVRGADIKCNPAIKEASDRDALVRAVIDGRIDVIATDHAPHTRQEKNQPYFKAPSGLPLVQHALPALLEHYHDGRFSLPLIVEKTSHAVARLFGVRERGFIREGYWADLVLVDLARPTAVSEQKIWSKCGWSPFAGQTLRATVDTTIVNGQVAYRHGRVFSDCRGQALVFDR
ncbi:MAG: dihydroorotase [Desulfobacterales bacterium]|nr:dihydroorotase [Desulfobacterales bacterium]